MLRVETALTLLKGNLKSIGMDTAASTKALDDPWISSKEVAKDEELIITSSARFLPYMLQLPSEHMRHGI